jgi:hypothetical protein
MHAADSTESNLSVLGVDVFRLGTAWSLDTVLSDVQAVLATVDRTLPVSSPRGHFSPSVTVEEAVVEVRPEEWVLIFLGFPGRFGRAWQDSNLRHTAPETV